MRCLGRIVLLAVLLLGVGVAWMFRGDIRRRVERALHPAAMASRVGRPSAAALKSATAKLELLQRTHRDSVLINADEMASLLAQGTSFLPGSTFDSISVELDDRSVRIRTLIDSAQISESVRRLIPGGPHRYEEVTARGALTPVRPGLAELQLEHVTLRGVPLPSAVIGKLANQLTGRGSDGRLEVILPSTVGGFRVRPEGVAIYRQGVIR